jgi:hypothetical protein
MTENILGFYWRKLRVKKVMNLKIKCVFLCFQMFPKNAFWLFFMNITIFNNKHISILQLCCK